MNYFSIFSESLWFLFEIQNCHVFRGRQKLAQQQNNKEGPRNLKSMQPPSTSIFLWLIFTGLGRKTMALLAPPDQLLRRPTHCDCFCRGMPAIPCWMEFWINSKENYLSTNSFFFEANFHTKHRCCHLQLLKVWFTAASRLTSRIEAVVQKLLGKLIWNSTLHFINHSTLIMCVRHLKCRQYLRTILKCPNH